MGRAITTVFPEAIIVGLLSYVAYYILTLAGASIELSSFLVGFFLHLLFEYSPFGNINEIWCRATFK